MCTSPRSLPVKNNRSSFVSIFFRHKQPPMYNMLFFTLRINISFISLRIQYSTLSEEMKKEAYDRGKDTMNTHPQVRTRKMFPQ